MRARYVSISSTLIVFAISGSAPLAADDPAELTSWWQTSCETFGDDSGPNAAFATFRSFPVTASSVDDPERAVTFFELGITFQIGGERFTEKWNELSRVTVKLLGNRHSALSLTIQTRDQELGREIYGNIEIQCWRLLEDVIRKHAPNVIEGSPPRPVIPNHDATTN